MRSCHVAPNKYTLTVVAFCLTIADCRVQPLKSRTLFASQRLKQSTSEQGDMSIQLSHSPNVLANLCNSMCQSELLAILILVSLINRKLEVILQVASILCTSVPLCITPCQNHRAIYTQLLHNSGHDAPAHPLAKLCATSGAVPSVNCAVPGVLWGWCSRRLEDWSYDEIYQNMASFSNS